MDRSLTLRQSTLASLLNSAYPNPDDAGPYGPFGPVMRRVIEVLLNPQPLPPKEGPLPDPWRSALTASAVIHSALERQELAEVGTSKANDLARQGIQEFLDDYCGTPPRLHWPFKWPRPKGWPVEAELGAVDVLVAAAQFHQIAESMPDHALANDFNAGADKLFDTGLLMLDKG